MVLWLCIMIQTRWQWQTNAPHPPAVLMATAVRRSNTDGIARCGISRATPEATGHRHRATTCSVLPQQPPGQQANKQQSTNTPTKLAVLMAMAMRWYVTTRIARWRRSRASLEATGHRHWVSIMSDNINRTWLRCFLLFFHCQNCRKRSQVDARTTVFNRGMTYQTKEKGLIKVSIKFSGGSIWQNNLWRSGCCIAFVFVETVSRAQLWTWIKTRNFVTFYKFLMHLGVHHTTTYHTMVSY